MSILRSPRSCPAPRLRSSTTSLAFLPCPASSMSACCARAPRTYTHGRRYGSPHSCCMPSRCQVAVTAGALLAQGQTEPSVQCLGGKRHNLAKNAVIGPETAAFVLANCEDEDELRRVVEAADGGQKRLRVLVSPRSAGLSIPADEYI